MRIMLLCACFLLAGCSAPEKQRFEALENLRAYKHKPIHYLVKTLGEPTRVEQTKGMSYYQWTGHREMPMAIYTTGAVRGTPPNTEDLSVIKHCAITAVVDKTGIMVTGGLSGNNDIPCLDYYNKLKPK